jgi:hypothetical protein
LGIVGVVGWGDIEHGGGLLHNQEAVLSASHRPEKMRDIVGKLDALRIECDKCGRRGQYRVDRLIEQYGIDAKLFDFESEADCPRKIARNDYDPCGARCPDLSKVV